MTARNCNGFILHTCWRHLRNYTYWRENLNEQTNPQISSVVYLYCVLIQAAQIAAQASEQKKSIPVETIWFLSIFFFKWNFKKKLKYSQLFCEACTSLSVWRDLKKLKNLSALWVAVLWLNLEKTVTKSLTCTFCSSSDQRCFMWLKYKNELCFWKWLRIPGPFSQRGWL